MLVVDGTEQGNSTTQRRDEIGRPVTADVALGTGHGGSSRIDDFDDATLPAHRRGGQGHGDPAPTTFGRVPRTPALESRRTRVDGPIWS
jgi:hypothetical protein